MTKPRLITACFGLFVSWAAPAAAHEFWVEPETFRVQPSTTIRADLRVGQHFRGNAFPYLKSRFVSLRAVQGQSARAIPGDEGDIPAVKMRPDGRGLQVIAYHSTADRLRFDAFADFVEYVEQEGLDWIVDAHRRRGLPETGFAEAYTRCAKTLVQVGEATEADRDVPTGMPLELVAGRNPYVQRVGGELPVTLLWGGKPIGGIQVTVFQDNGSVRETRLRTDAAGQAVVPLQGGGRFMLSAVYMQEAPPGGDAVWESYWASLTFEAQP